VYLDSAYIAKYYLNEPDSGQVRAVIRTATSLMSSAWALGEVTCAFHRYYREGGLTASQSIRLADDFLKHVDAGVWTLLPVTEGLLRRMSAIIRLAPATIYLRTGDAIHLITASEAGEREIWSSDRHLFAAAHHFGLIGRRA